MTLMARLSWLLLAPAAAGAGAMPIVWSYLHVKRPTGGREAGTMCSNYLASRLGR